LVGCTSVAAAPTISARIIKVTDGDSIVVSADGLRRKIRLHGIDCPEVGQTFGNEAKAFTLKIAMGKMVTLRPTATDRYGRLVAIVHIGKIVLNEALLRSGLAWHYKKYDKNANWAALEVQARSKKLGLWRDKTALAPWLWRKQKRDGARSQGPNGILTYRGNTRSKVYHHRRCPDWKCKRCRIGFAGKPEALAAGYHAHKDCVEKATNQ
jgi:micrococcal nuclease